MNILGIGGITGDAAAAVLQDSGITAAVEESKLSRRLARRSQAPALPKRAIEACLGIAGIGAQQVDCVAVARPLGAGVETNLHLQLRAAFPGSNVVMVDHHLAHAASAYYASPFEEATVLTLDRAGDFRCGARWHGSGTQLALETEAWHPDSLGEVYGRVTELLGFASNADEHKVQWLSTAGDDRYAALFLEILNRGAGGWPRVDRSFFDAERLLQGGFSEKFLQRVVLEDAAAIAAGIQRATEQTVGAMARGARNLCLAGGLGLNALLVRALETRGEFDSVFVQPAAGNAGTALGAALQAAGRRVPLTSLFLGPAYDAEQIKQVVENCKLRFRYLLTTGELIETAVEQLSENKIVAWMQGRMEFGPRALGNRSILASPLDPYSTENLNAFIKHRESFRKFAASAPAELMDEYFEAGPNARFLATVGRVREPHRERFRSAILADDLIRVHAVSRDDNPLYWELLHAAGRKTGLPVLYNTSFNLFGEPLICTPRDAVRSFYSSGIDALFVGGFFLRK